MPEKAEPLSEAEEGADWDSAPETGGAGGIGLPANGDDFTVLCCGVDAG